MALTPNLTIVPVTGTYVDIEGNPIAGQVKFTPRTVITDAIYGQIIISNTITATLDTNGSFTAYLPATDDTSVTPTGFTYEVVESFTNGRTFDMAVPAVTVGSINLATVIPATSNAGTATLYVSSAQYTSVANRITVVEGYSTSIGTASIAATTSSANATAAAASASTAATQATNAANNAKAYFSPLLLLGV